MIVHASVGIMPHGEVVYLCDCLISFAAVVEQVDLR